MIAVVPNEIHSARLPIKFGCVLISEPEFISEFHRSVLFARSSQPKGRGLRSFTVSADLFGLFFTGHTPFGNVFANHPWALAQGIADVDRGVCAEVQPHTVAANRHC